MFTQLHCPPAQAIMWHNICSQLGIYVTLNICKVQTVCLPAERETAWELFKEEFERLVFPANNS